ncbi:hypothetical protein GUJ93_ZPchr0001g30586 [Zizania palustris]|uniref:Ribosomal protein L9 domain-containing protein n=1 Tax=Zizania palustris TaxID=103762 RepID=A0A8J5RDE8_ZIZPA|nr:hypothetical protein GUJ93_ZPchr0001g30586 [Zizania palustris]
MQRALPDPPNLLSHSANAMASSSCASTLAWSAASSVPPSRPPARWVPSSLVIVAQGKVKKYRQIILTDDIAEVGKKGDTLKVRAGFSRNFLLPKGNAQLLTPEVLKEMQLEQERI